MSWRDRNDVTVTNIKNSGVSVLKGLLTQRGTNDLATGNGLPNLLGNSLSLFNERVSK